MEKIKLKYRTWGTGIPPQPIRIGLPGWAGHDNRHDNGAEAQPWHCTPFVEGSCYGLELIYSFDAECVVTTVNGKMHFEGDFGKEMTGAPDGGPPFGAFAPGHYGMTSALDLLPPEGYVFRLEPHPRFYTDTVGDVPLVVPGHIQRFWPKIFFVVFKAPFTGQRHVFRKGEPYGQILILPQKVAYDIQPMTPEEANFRAMTDNAINTGKSVIRKHRWRSSDDNEFDDKYKQLARIYNKGGDAALQDALTRANAAVAAIKPRRPARVIGRKKHNEAEKNQTHCPYAQGLHSGHTGAATQGQYPPPSGDQGQPT